MNLRRDPLGEHARIWLAHVVQPDERVAVRAGGCIAFPVGCGLGAQPVRVGAIDSQAYIPASGPVLLPTADSMRRNREAWTRMRSVG